MSLFGLMVAAAAGQTAVPPAAAPGGTMSLVHCGFQSLDLSKMTGTGEPRRLAILFSRRGGRNPAIDVASLRVFDPTDLLAGLPMNKAAYRDRGRMLTMETGSGGRGFYRFAISPSPRAPGRWWGGLALNGGVHSDQALARSYIGECTVEEPADAAARFDALRNEQ
jgi:hypothetical protein